MDSLTSAIILYNIYCYWHFCALFQCVLSLAWSVLYSKITVHLSQSFLLILPCILKQNNLILRLEVMTVVTMKVCQSVKNKFKRNKVLFRSVLVGVRKISYTMFSANETQNMHIYTDLSLHWDECQSLRLHY